MQGTKMLCSKWNVKGSKENKRRDWRNLLEFFEQKPNTCSFVMILMSLISSQRTENVNNEADEYVRKCKQTKLFTPKWEGAAGRTGAVITVRKTDTSEQRTNSWAHHHRLTSQRSTRDERSLTHKKRSGGGWT